MRVPLSIVVLWLAACGGGTGPGERDASLSDAEVVADDASGCDGCVSPGPVCRFLGTEFAGAATSGVRIGEQLGGAFTAWADGQSVPYVWGPQGGTMIQPMLSIDGALVAGDAPCLVVELRNVDPTGMHRFDTSSGFTLAFSMTRVGDRLLVGPLFDPFGTTDVDAGTPLRLEVTVTGETFSVTGAVDLALLPPAWPAPPGHDCSAYAITGTGCHYRVFPGHARITAIESPDPSEASCAVDPRRVRYEFIPDPSVDTGCFLFPDEPMLGELRTGGGYHPPSACLAPLGIEVGSDVPMERREVVGGTCAPVYFTAGSLLDPCDAACFP